MQQFIPFEDDWDALEHLPLEALLPYRVDMSCVHRGNKPASSVGVVSMPAAGAPTMGASVRIEVPAGSSRQAC